MLVEKSMKEYVSTSKYICDMCRKEIKKQDRILVATSEKGKDNTLKRWDLCENCMKIIEKNILIWYNRQKNKKCQG